MRTSIATVCVPGVLQEKLEAIAAAGFRAVEIFETDLIAYPGSPRDDVRAMCADLGLTIVTCQPFRDFEGMPAEKRQRPSTASSASSTCCRSWGPTCSSSAPASRRTRLAGSTAPRPIFRELGERAARRSLRVGYEALAWGRHVSDWRDSWEIVRRADHAAVGLILDNFHIQARGSDLNALRSVPGDRIAFVQIADAPRLQMDYLSWARHWRCLPGQGDFDLVGFMDALETTGYGGWLSLEIFNDRFRAGSARSVALDGRRLADLADGRGLAQGGPAIPGATPMPPPAAVAQVEFIEFAVGEAELPEFEALLRAMGFARAGRHRSKQVSLWTQGSIRIVLNSEPAGFAHAYRTTHGLSVCAMASGFPTRGPPWRGRARCWRPRTASRSAPASSTSGDPGPGRQPAALRRRGLAAGALAGGGLRRHRREGGGRGPHAHRPRLADDAVRGDADLAPVLRLAAGHAEDAEPGRCSTQAAWCRAR